MSNLDEKEEKKVLEEEYKALKKYLGELLLEQNAQEENPDDVAYFTRKFEETRQKLRDSR